jgi:hypothetical protein
VVNIDRLRGDPAGWQPGCGWRERGEHRGDGLRRRRLAVSFAAATIGVAGLCGPPVGPNRGDDQPVPSDRVGTCAAGGAAAGQNASPVAGCVALSSRPCDLYAPAVATVRIDAALNTTFSQYAETTPDGWTGGDSTFSVRIPDGRTLWLFSDTFLGPLNKNGTRPANAHVVNNSFVVQAGSRLTTVVGGAPGRPAAIMPPPDVNHWYWVGDGQIVGGQLQVIFQEYRLIGPTNWQFALDRSVVATFSLTDLATPVSVDPLPSLSGVAWGAALLPASRSGDGYTYIYGIGGTGGTGGTVPGGKAMRVARVRGDDVRQRPWWFYTPSGWTRDERLAADVLPAIANEYSVTPWNGMFLLVTQESTESFSNRIVAMTSCSPWGPFTKPALIYQMPESGAAGSYHDNGVIGYNAHVHAELSAGDTFLISYNVHNVQTAAAVYQDPGIYRPRFILVTLKQADRA